MIIFNCKKCFRTNKLSSIQCSYCNPIIEICKICKSEIDQIELEDHMYCHQLEEVDKIPEKKLIQNEISNKIIENVKKKYIRKG